MSERDWIQAAAEEINLDLEDPFGEYGAERAAEIIRKHLPRCKTCRHWHEGITPSTTDAMMAEARMGCAKLNAFLGNGVRVTPPADFGCVEHEPFKGVR